MNLMSNKEKLRNMLEVFVSGNDRSAAFSSKIEGFLIEHFYEDEDFQDLLLALASYSPCGGDFLYDEAALLKVIEGSLNVLRPQLDG